MPPREKRSNRVFSELGVLGGWAVHLFRARSGKATTLGRAFLDARGQEEMQQNGRKSGRM
jgi:hypothetical protein